jgi:hypothetical protein
MSGLQVSATSSMNGEVDRHGYYIHATRLDLGKVEDIAHQRQQMPPGPVDAA